MTTVTSMKCACEPCLCNVSISDAIAKDGKYYCSEACANGHPDGKGCGHHGCGCRSSWVGWAIPTLFNWAVISVW